MNKIKASWLGFVWLLFISNCIAQPFAFPTAEGAGKFTTGGRGSSTSPTVVYKVTSLADDGSVGTLRYAINQSVTNRTIVFAISGTIRLTSALSIKANTTIAGQTAPGDGICIADYPVTLGGNNIIVRYIRFRLGDKNQLKTTPSNCGVPVAPFTASCMPLNGSGGDDAFGGTARKNIIIDHCTMSWSNDEACSIYGGDSTTIQWCMLSEPLNYSYHFETGDADFEYHGYGGIWGGRNATFHHNLLAHCQGRACRFDGSRNLSGGTTAGLENCEFNNNVIYNWGSYNVNGAEGGNYNIRNNYYKFGPSTNSGVRSQILNPYKSVNLPYGQFFLSGNVVDSNTSVTNNNWLGVKMNGGTAADTTTAKVTTAFNMLAVNNIESATSAYTNVLNDVGATLPGRDTLDARIVLNVQNRTGAIIDVQGGYPHAAAFNLTTSAWPTLQSGTNATDTDNDGMPNWWERQNGLNANNANDRYAINAQGYTNLEVYLNAIPAWNSHASFTSITNTRLSKTVLRFVFTTSWVKDGFKYGLFRSTDNVNYSKITDINSNMDTTGFTISDSSLVNGTLYYKIGSYKIGITKDTLYSTVITFDNAPVYSTTTINTCDSALPYTWNGNAYNTSGTYAITLNTATWKDSIATLILNASPCVFTTTWTGNTSSNLTTASNWSNGVPTNLAHIIISSTAVNNPVLTSSITCNNLSIANGKSIDLNGNNITVNGQLNAVGTIIGSPTSTLTINGSNVSHSLNFSQTTSGNSNALYNLLINTTNSTVVLNSTLHLYNNLQVTNGSFNANDKLIVLKSTSSRTAGIDNITGSITNATNITVERFKNNRRAWILATSPLTAFNASGTTQNNTNSNTGTIKDNWQQNTIITGNASNGTNGGLDAGVNNTWGILQWSGNAWQNVTNTTNTYSLFNNNTNGLSANKSFFLFIRGNRTVIPNTNLSASSNVTLAANGTLQQGTLTQSITNTTYALVANPYPATISLENFRVDNSFATGAIFHYWDPSRNNTGGYVSCVADGNGTFTSTAAGTNQNVYIHSGQSFFITNPNSTSVVFKESQKFQAANHLTNTAFGATSHNKPALFIQLLKQDTTALTVMDGVIQLYDATYHNQVFTNTEDVLKLYNSGENLSILKHGQQLAIEKTIFPIVLDTIQLHIAKLANSTSYILKFNKQFTGIDSLYPILFDKYTQATCNLLSDTSYTFTVTNDAASKAVDRFIIYYYKVNSLPVTWIYNHLRYDKEISLSWKIKSNLSVQNFEILAAEKDLQFHPIPHNLILPNASNMYCANLDIEHLKYNYFKIKANFNNHSYSYSDVLKLNKQLIDKNITIINPIENHVIKLAFNNYRNLKTKIQILSAEGKVVFSCYKNVNQKGILSINIPSNLVGFYYLVMPDLNWVESVIVNK